MRSLKRIILIVVVLVLGVLLTPKSAVDSLKNTVINFVEEGEKQQVEFVYAIDGDTAVFMVNGKEESIRFLSINCPEYTSSKEKWGKEATEFTKSVLKNAKTIEIEKDHMAMDRDNYDRLLRWVWVDGQLIEELLVSNSLASVSYTNGQYKYDKRLMSLEEEAKQAKTGIWSE